MSCCVTCPPLPALAPAAVWSSLSPLGALTNPKPLGSARGHSNQYNLCVFCGCLIHLLPDKQQWKITRPSTDKPSPRAATSHCYCGTAVRAHFPWSERCFGLRSSPGHLDSSCRSLGALHRGSSVTRHGDTVAMSSCVLTRGAGTGLRSREETGGVDLSIIVCFSKWPLSAAAVWWHFEPR